MACVSEGWDNQRMSDYELVRVAHELLKELLDKGSQPVVVLAVNRLEDGTHEMVVRQVVGHFVNEPEPIEVSLPPAESAASRSD